MGALAAGFGLGALLRQMMGACHECYSERPNYILEQLVAVGRCCAYRGHMLCKSAGAHMTHSNQEILAFIDRQLSRLNNQRETIDQDIIMLEYLQGRLRKGAFIDPERIKASIFVIDKDTPEPDNA